MKRRERRIDIFQAESDRIQRNVFFTWWSKDVVSPDSRVIEKACQRPLLNAFGLHRFARCRSSLEPDRKKPSIPQPASPLKVGKEGWEGKEEKWTEEKGLKQTKFPVTMFNNIGVRHIFWFIILTSTENKQYNLEPGRYLLLEDNTNNQLKGFVYQDWYLAYQSLLSDPHSPVPTNPKLCHKFCLVLKSFRLGLFINVFSYFFPWSY